MRNIDERINSIKTDIRELSHNIHENPELGNEEFNAVKLQKEVLEKYGFEVEVGIADLPTAYQAIYKGEKAGPVLGYIAEYDALPELGHACGHSLICGLAICAAIVMRDSVDTYGGEIRVIGAPAEETMGGKTILAEKGFYDDLTLAMMAHPGEKFAASGNMNAMEALQFEYFGRPAHAAAFPENGINALDGVIGLFNSVNALRQHVLPTTRIHGIITHGGVAPNIVPEYACARFYVRSHSRDYLKILDEKVKKCAEGSALSSGARLEISNFEATYDNMVTNQTLSDEIQSALHELGIDYKLDVANTTGSSDIGNVSFCCPCTHEWFGVTNDVTIKPHTKEFEQCADSDYAYDSLFLMAKAFVMTSEKILTDPQLLKDILAEYSEMKA